VKIKKIKDSATRCFIADDGKDLLHQLQDMEGEPNYFCLLASEENENILLNVYSLNLELGGGFCIYTDSNSNGYIDVSVKTPEEAADIIKKLYKLQVFH
jgi:hypothetical protein